MRLAALSVSDSPQSEAVVGLLSDISTKSRLRRADQCTITSDCFGKVNRIGYKWSVDSVISARYFLGMTCAIQRAPFASLPEESRGRLHVETGSLTRSVFQRDRDRIVHCAAFRRLEHKTQVFVHHEGDHYRSRLTHTLEVAQIARSICRELGLNEDLAETLSLAHDLGHTPFGHAGEDSLNEAMASYGGFDHNAQTLRIVTTLERRYGGFDGLNLTWETLEGIVKHNGPLSKVVEPIRSYNDSHDLELKSFAGPEAQVAALADDIAYNNHDIDDALRAGFIELEDLADMPLVGPVINEVCAIYPDITVARKGHECIRRVIDRMVTDLVQETRQREKLHKPASAQAVRDMEVPLVSFSESMRAQNETLQGFLFERMYRHYRVSRMASKARRVVRDLFRFFNEEPECLPTEWGQQSGPPASPKTARLVGDYVAGMTDRYALDEHARIFDPTIKI